jgi:hypothetical protein
MPVLRRKADTPTGSRPIISGLGIAAVIAATPSFGVALRSGIFGRVRREMWRDPRAVRAIGRRYLAIARDEADRARLSDLVFGRADLADDSFAALQRHIATERARDFAADDTVILDGWILSRTEARLCALSALA